MRKWLSARVRKTRCITSSPALLLLQSYSYIFLFKAAEEVDAAGERTRARGMQRLAKTNNARQRTLHVAFTLPSDRSPGAQISPASSTPTSPPTSPPVSLESPSPDSQYSRSATSEYLPSSERRTSLRPSGPGHNVLSQFVSTVSQEKSARDIEKRGLMHKGIERQDESINIQREALALLRETRDLQKANLGALEEQNSILHDLAFTLRSRRRASSVSIPSHTTTPPPGSVSTPTSPQKSLRRKRWGCAADRENVAP